MVDRRSSLARNRFDQIPPVSIEVFEDRHDAIWFMARRFDKSDTPLCLGEVVTGKVVCIEKQEHATAALIADRLTLPVANSSR